MPLIPIPSRHPRLDRFSMGLLLLQPRQPSASSALASVS